MKQQQIELLKNSRQFFKPFGGSLLKNSNAKTSRPLSIKQPMHVVLRSSEARGKKSFRYGKNHMKVNGLIRRVCEKHGVRLYEFSNNGNHIHLLLRLHKHFLWAPFIRELSGKITMLIVGFGKREKSFFDQRPFSRIVNGWRRAYRIAKDYVVLNQMEAAGVTPYRPRNSS